MLSITKLQNLKAIHNCLGRPKNQPAVVINRKTTKFESNSQQIVVMHNANACCYQSQNYKIWKQFTTALLLWFSHRQLLSITKLQNLKAIHNKGSDCNNYKKVVINHKTTKFESNSQQLLCCCVFCNVVINRKTTKFESNSQLYWWT